MTKSDGGHLLWINLPNNLLHIRTCWRWIYRRAIQQRVVSFYSYFLCWPRSWMISHGDCGRDPIMSRIRQWRHFTFLKRFEKVLCAEESFARIYGRFSTTSATINFWPFSSFIFNNLISQTMKRTQKASFFNFAILFLKKTSQKSVNKFLNLHQ